MKKNSIHSPRPRDERGRFISQPASQPPSPPSVGGFGCFSDDGGEDSPHVQQTEVGQIVTQRIRARDGKPFASVQTYAGRSRILLGVLRPVRGGNRLLQYSVTQFSSVGDNGLSPLPVSATSTLSPRTAGPCFSEFFRHLVTRVEAEYRHHVANRRNRAARKAAAKKEGGENDGQPKQGMML